ncbi:MAG: ATP-binding protein [Cyanobacteria bacterium]|nr:ATP-binding protein [Cyanobacteriota bacterium]MDW8202080.1 ATP-binding protein [Cyanobacteriota bacterium SKYGB_h_bin112]
MLAVLKLLRDTIINWWAKFTLQTKLMAVATLVVSLLMSGLTFWAVNTIQQDARLNDTRFGRDLGLLLAANVAPLVGENNRTELARFSHRFYSSTSSIRYMLYADADGEIFFGIPFSESEVKTSLTLRRRIQLPENYAENSELPMVRQHRTPDGEVTDVFVPLIQDGKYLGVLAIGINPNPTVVTSSGLTRDVTIAVFVSIWVMVVLGAVFNALTITKPIKELLMGVKNIAAGNFKQRIDLPLGGELGELILSFNDMAERLERYEEQNIEELTAEKAKLDTLVSTIADGAVLLDPNLRIVLVNPIARRIFGWENKPLIGDNILYNLPGSVAVALTRPLYQLTRGEVPTLTLATNSTDEHSSTPVDSKPAHYADSDSHLPVELADASAHGDEQTALDRSHVDLKHLDAVHHTRDHTHDDREGLEYRLTLSEPINRTVRILLTTVYDSARENLKGIAMTIQDITREAELNEAKSQFISNVSHELRTPLFNIKSFIETLHEFGDELSEAERREFLETANHETDRLTRLVNDVLDLSKLESNKRYHFNGVDLAQIIEQTLRTYQLNAKDKGINLIHAVDPQLPLVLGNYDLLLQVFTNLVGNALKFTEPGGTVLVRAYLLDATTSLYQKPTLLGQVETGNTLNSPCVPITPPQDQWLPAASDRDTLSHQNWVTRVEVSDTGIGIDSEDQEAIFDRFFRVENRVHTLEGTGLGLSIVRNIVEKHQSRVHLVSAVGVGTTFWFDLPLYKPEPLPDNPNLPVDDSAPAHDPQVITP